MTLQDNIKKISTYFKGFNISDNVAYIVVNFPKNWTMPDEEILLNAYNTKMASDENGIYFFTDIENGTDVLFSSVEHVVTFNKEMEERIALFNEKITELKEIFTNEPFEKLKTVTITFEKIKKTKAKPNSKKTKKEEKNATEEIPEENNEQSSMMNFVEKIVEE